jgi:hypothetical protein
MPSSAVCRKLGIIVDPFKAALPWHIPEFPERLAARSLKKLGKLDCAR